MFDRFCSLNVWTLGSDSRASAPKRRSFAWPAVAKAQEAIDSSWALSSDARASVSSARQA